MITAKEARSIANDVLEPIPGSIEFKAIMAGIERNIRELAKNGKTSFDLAVYILPAMNNHKFPSCVDANKIDKDHFWWPYVKAELEKNGYSIGNTMTFDHYLIKW